MTQSYTPSYAMNSHHVASINLSTPPAIDPSTASEQQWKHFLTKTPLFVSRKLLFIGITFIIIALLSVGLELRLVIGLSYGSFVGFLNGSFLFSLGILTLILGHQQIYVLSNLFVVAFFQLMLTICTFILYCIFASAVFSDSDDCSSYQRHCYTSERRIIIIVDLIHTIVTFCLLITTFVIISSARRPPITPVISSYVAYVPGTQSIPTSFHNPAAVAINQSSSA